MKTIFVSFMIFASSIAFSQDLRSLRKMKPKADYENIHAQKISEDALQSSFVIWIKSSVAEHFHAEHTENIYIISGKAIMTLGDSTFTIRKGDHLTIPKGTHHAVTEVLGRKPLHVLSIQSPKFEGKDRIFTKKN